MNDAAEALKALWKEVPVGARTAVVEEILYGEHKAVKAFLDTNYNMDILQTGEDPLLTVNRLRAEVEELKTKMSRLEARAI